MTAKSRLGQCVGGARNGLLQFCLLALVVLFGGGCDGARTTGTATSRQADHPGLPFGDRVGDPLPPGALARFGTLRFRHTLSLDSIQFSPDGKTFAGAGADQTIHLWDSLTGKEIRRFSGHRDRVSRVVFAPDGQRLISASWDDTLRVWDINTGNEICQLLGHATRVKCIAIRSDGKLAASGDDLGNLFVWDVASRTVVRKLSCGSVIYGVTFSPKGDCLAAATHNYHVCRWNTQTWQPIKPFREGGTVYSLAISHNGKYLACGGGGGAVEIWDLQQSKLLHSIDLRRLLPIMAVAFSPCDTTLAVGGVPPTITDTVEAQLFEVVAGKPIRQFRGLAFGCVKALSFSPDGRRLVAGCVDAMLQLWDVSTGKNLLPAYGHQEPVRALCFSSAGQILASASNDRTIRLWQPRTAEELHVLTGHQDQVTAISFSPDGKFLASASKDETVRLWDTCTGASRWILHPRSRDFRSESFCSVAISPDGKSIYAGDANGIIWAWDAQTATLLGAWKRHDGPINCLVFSPDGRVLATSGQDTAIRVWDVAKQNKIVQLGQHAHEVTALAFTPDGQTLVSGGADTFIRCWSWPPRRGQQPIDNVKQWVSSLAFTSDGRFLAVATHDGPITVWDMAARRKLCAWRHTHGSCWCVAFSGLDGSLASGGTDTTVLLWDMKHILATAIPEHRHSKRAAN